MNKRVGLWLDLNKAVIVSITDGGEERKRFTSDMENYVRYSINVPGDGSPEDARDRRFWAHLGEYYEKVVANIRDARAIRIFGPGEAKFEIKKRLTLAGLVDHIVIMDEIGVLTDREIALKVREWFPSRSQYDLN